MTNRAEGVISPRQTSALKSKPQENWMIPQARWARFLGQPVKSWSCSLTDRSNTTAKATLVTSGFWWPTSLFPRNCRQRVYPYDTKGMGHGTAARLPDGSGANSRLTKVVWVRPWSRHRLR